MILIKWKDRNKSTSYRLFKETRHGHKWINALKKVGLFGEVVDIEKEMESIFFKIKTVKSNLEFVKNRIKEHSLELKSLLESDDDYCSKHYAFLIEELHKRHNLLIDYDLRINNFKNQLLHINPEYFFSKYSID